MRGIIRPQRVYRRLHRDAAEHFEAKAQDDPGQWERWTREALYHRFQLNGANAARYWRRAMDAAGEHPSLREAIAIELFEPDYVDEERQPIQWSHERLMVAPQTLIQAHFELGCARADLARAREVSPGDPLWTAVEDSIAEVEHGQERLGQRVVPAARLAQLKAALDLKDGRTKEAEKVLRRALRTATDDADAARLWTLLGDSQITRHDRAAPASYERARNAAAKGPTRSHVAEIDLKLVVALLDLDRFGEAYDAYRRALSEHVSRVERARLHLFGAVAGIRTGHAVWAENGRHRARAGGDWDAWAPRIAAALDRLEPVHARVLVADAERSAGTATAGGVLDPSAQAAFGRQLAGDCAVAVMQLDEAFAALETARSLWQSQGDAESQAACYTRSAALKLRSAGDVKAAEHYLREADELVLPKAADAWLDVRLLRAELHRHQGADAEAASLVRATLQELREAHAPPRRLIRASVAGSPASDSDEQLLLLDLLLAQCELVTPASARILLLRDLRRVPGFEGKGARERVEQLRRGVRIESGGRLFPTDRGVLNLTLAELDRLSGNRVGAARRLTAAREQLSGNGTAFFLREWWLAVDRLGQESATASPIRDAKVFRDELAEFPLLCAAFLIERIEAMPGSKLQSTRELLDDIGSLLERAPEYETKWHARLLQARARLEGRTEFSRKEGYLGAAAAIYVALGDAVMARIAGDARDEPLAKLEAARARVVIFPAGRSRGPERSPRSRARLSGMAGEAAADELENWARGPSLELSPLHFEDRWIRDQVRAGAEVGSLLIPEVALGALRTSPTSLDVRVEVQPDRLDFVPWEARPRPGPKGLSWRSSRSYERFRGRSRRRRSLEKRLASFK